MRSAHVREYFWEVCFGVAEMAFCGIVAWIFLFLSPLRLQREQANRRQMTLMYSLKGQDPSGGLRSLGLGKREFGS